MIPSLGFHTSSHKKLLYYACPQLGILRACQSLCCVIDTLLRSLCSRAGKWLCCLAVPGSPQASEPKAEWCQQQQHKKNNGKERFYVILVRAVIEKNALRVAANVCLLYGPWTPLKVRADLSACMRVCLCDPGPLDPSVQAKCSPCVSSPCQNQGTCQVQPTQQYTCTCKSGFTVGSFVRRFVSRSRLFS